MMTVPPQLTSSLPSFSYPASFRHPPPASSEHVAQLHQLQNKGLHDFVIYGTHSGHIYSGHAVVHCEIVHRSARVQTCQMVMVILELSTYNIGRIGRYQWFLSNHFGVGLILGLLIWIEVLAAGPEIHQPVEVCIGLLFFTSLIATKGNWEIADMTHPLLSLYYIHDYTWIC